MAIHPSFGLFRYLLLILLVTATSLAQTIPPDFHFNSSGQTAVTLSDKGVFEATINGKGPFKLFFDTGASVNILNPEVIAQLGLAPGGLQEDLYGFNGRKLDAAKPWHADELRIGDLSLLGQTFYSIPSPWPGDKNVVGAIGYELLRRVVVQADYQHQRLVLADPARFAYHGKGEKLDLLPDESQSLVIEARVGDAPGSFQLDSGACANIGVTLNKWFIEKQGLLHSSGRNYYGVFSSGSDGYSPPAVLKRIKTFCLGAACVPRLVGEYSSEDTSHYAGRINNVALRKFILTIDWPHHAVYLEKTRRWKRPNVYNKSGLLLYLSEDRTALMVAQVFPFSLASKAGIKQGDRILLIDNHPPDPNWYSDDSAFLQSGRTVLILTVQHDNTTRQIKLKLKDIL